MTGRQAESGKISLDEQMKIDFTYYTTCCTPITERGSRICVSCPSHTSALENFKVRNEIRKLMNE